jgi:hypothetical protein
MIQDALRKTDREILGGYFRLVQTEIDRVSDLFGKTGPLKVDRRRKSTSTDE